MPSEICPPKLRDFLNEWIPQGSPYAAFALGVGCAIYWMARSIPPRELLERLSQAESIEEAGEIIDTYRDAHQS